MIKEILNSFEMIPSSLELSSLSTPTDDRTSQTARSVLQNDPGTPPLSALSDWEWNLNPSILKGQLNAIEEIDLDNLPEEADEAPSPPPLLKFISPFEATQADLKYLEKRAQLYPSADPETAPSPLPVNKKKKKREEEPSEGIKRQKPESGPEGVSAGPSANAAIAAIGTPPLKTRGKRIYTRRSDHPDIQELIQRALKSDDVNKFLKKRENKRLLRKHKLSIETVKHLVSKAQPVKKCQSLVFEDQPPEVKALIQRIHNSDSSIRAYLQDRAHLEEIQKLNLSTTRVKGLMNRYNKSQPKPTPAAQMSHFPSELPTPTRKKPDKPFRPQSYHEQPKGLQKHIRRADRLGKALLRNSSKQRSCLAGIAI